ncbi:hypothetical protein Psi01_81890 [Planobispora siamensis]|uniref:Uncharacterized protein n=1 Tax=Planobispora siamensis TaxID=936338 RepID=A0A8J3SQM2_9ACTN|nr:hypothetical protein Psi01_81890 [Planobispora siamensis]
MTNARHRPGRRGGGAEAAQPGRGLTDAVAASQVAEGLGAEDQVEAVAGVVAEDVGLKTVASAPSTPSKDGTVPRTDAATPARRVSSLPKRSMAVFRRTRPRSSFLSCQTASSRAAPSRGMRATPERT